MASHSQGQGESAEELGLEGFRQEPESEGLSLDQLSDAFAEMLGQGEDPYEAEPDDQEESDEAAAELALGVPDDAVEDESCEISPETILEAMVFVGSGDGQPLSARQIASLMRGVRAEEIDPLVRSLNARYAEDGCPYQIVSDGSGFRLVLREEFDRVRNKFYGRAREARLSQAAIEVLAIVGYGQPISRDELNRRRGTASGAILSHLVRRQLLAIERTEDKPRRVLYRTTDRFLNLFGLESLADLPQSQELNHQ